MLKLNLPSVLVMTTISLSFASAFAQEQRSEGRGFGGRGHGPRMQLTDSQKTCLDSKVGSPETNTERPSKEKMDEALAACGIEKPSRPQGEIGGGKRGHGPQLTDAQKQCLEAEVGAKDSGTRPSREQMDSALKKCGVEAPKRGSSVSSSNDDESAQYAQITSAYLAATTSAAQDLQREELKALYFRTKDQNLKARIQNFLSSHLPAAVASASETESVSSILSKGGGTR